MTTKNESTKQNGKNDLTSPALCMELRTKSSSSGVHKRRSIRPSSSVKKYFFKVKSLGVTTRKNSEKIELENINNA